ncbi:MAG TPA: mechanosensitive ion channel family protein [Xanthomonadaceae bacterium]|nr:mechanosensitive ion channel family protein [Xanthomonadaceae bacterium]
MRRPPRLQAAACLCLLATALSGVPAAHGAPRAAVPANTAPATATANQVAAEVRAGRKEDGRIATAVAAKLLRQPNLQKVTVEVNAGVVTLSGAAPADADRDRAATLARQVEGVGDVVNDIQLDADLRTRFDAALNETRGKLVRGIAALPLIAIGLVIVLLSVWLGRVLARRPASWLRARSHNPYMDGLVRRTVQAVVVLVGIVLALDLLDATTLVSALLGSAGVVGLVAGFAFKDIAENYVAGILLSLRRPFAPGDHLLIDKYDGKVVALTSRATLLLTLDGNQVSLPNALVFKSVVTNYSQNPRRRFDYEITLDPSACIADAQRTALEALRTVDGVLPEPGPYVLVQEMLPDRVTLKALAWIDQRRNDLKRVRSEAMRSAAAALDRVGIRRAGVPAPTPASMEQAGVSPGDTSADTSVDRAIDPQLAEAQQAQVADNLLAPRPATPP